MSKFEKEFNDINPDIDIYPETFHQQIRTDLQVNPSDLATASLNNSKLHHRYNRMMKRAEGRLEQADADHREIVHGLYMYYEGRAKPDIYKDRPFDLTLSKTELDRYVRSNPAFRQSERIVNLWKRRIDFLKDICNDIRNRSYHIHNAIEFLKFNQGEL